MDFGLDKGALQCRKSVRTWNAHIRPWFSSLNNYYALLKTSRGINSVQTSKERIYYEQLSSNPTTTKNFRNELKQRGEPCSPEHLDATTVRRRTTHSHWPTMDKYTMGHTINSHLADSCNCRCSTIAYNACYTGIHPSLPGWYIFTNGELRVPIVAAIAAFF